MTTRCYACRTCGREWEESGVGQPFCLQCGSFDVRRNYRAENVGLGSGVRVSRDGTTADQKKLFLPDNSEFAGPGDPDGSKGMRDWHETHHPKGKGTSVGDIGRKVF